MSIDLSKLYQKEPFLIKKGYDELYHALYVLSKGPHRIPIPSNKWRYPQSLEMSFFATKKDNQFLSFRPLEETQLTTPVLVQESSAYLQFFNSSLRHEICLRSVNPLRNLKVYTAYLGVLPALDVTGKPCIFNKVTNVHFQVQGLPFLFFATDGDFERITLTIKAKAPIPEPTPISKKVYLVDGCRKQELYQLVKKGLYWEALPSPQMAAMYHFYELDRLKSKIPFPSLSLTAPVIKTTGAPSGDDLKVNFFNESNGDGSYFFFPSIEGRYAWGDFNGKFIGLTIPIGKEAVLHFPELIFSYSQDYQDEGDWEFVIEYGSVHSPILYKTFPLQKTSTGYGLVSSVKIKDIIGSGLHSISFHIVNLGKAAGILGIKTGVNCKLFLR